MRRLQFPPLFIVLVVLLALLGSPASFAATFPLFNFDCGICKWSLYGDKHGNTTGSTLKADTESVTGNKVLVVDYTFNALGPSKQAYFNVTGDISPQVVDLTKVTSLKFSVKGDGSGTRYFVWLWDKNGNRAVYGVQSTNTDFILNHTDWQERSINFTTDKPVLIKGAYNPSEIVKIGVQLNSGNQFDRQIKVPYRGSVRFDRFIIESNTTPIRLSIPNSSGQVPPAWVNNPGVFRLLQNDGTEVAVQVEKLSLHSDEITKVEIAFLRNRVLASPKNAVVWLGDHMFPVTPASDGSYVTWVGSYSKKEQTLAISYSEVEGCAADAPRLFVTPINILDRYIVNQAQQVFPIGTWIEGHPKSVGAPPVDPLLAAAYFDRLLPLIRQSGIEVIVVPNLPKESRALLLQKAEQYRLQVVLEIVEFVQLIQKGVTDPVQIQTTIHQVVDELHSYPALLAYQLIDEPSSNELGSMQLVKMHLAAADTQHPAFSTFASKEAMQAYAVVAAPDMLVQDRYPLAGNSPAGDFGRFIADVAEAGSTSRNAQAPLWMVLQAFSKPGTRRMPEPAELRFMTYYALAQGSKGIFYFIFPTLSPTHMGEYLTGLVDPSFQPLPLLAEMTRLTDELKLMRPLLLGLSYATVQAVSTINSHSFATTLTSPTGETYLVVVNSDVTAVNTIKLFVKKGETSGVPNLVDLRSGSRITFQVEDDYLTAEITLAPGDGCILKLVGMTYQL